MNAEKMELETSVLGHNIKVNFEVISTVFRDGYGVRKVELLHSDHSDVLERLIGVYPLKIMLDQHNDALNLFEKAAIGFFDQFMDDLTKEYHEKKEKEDAFILRKTHPYDGIGEVTVNDCGPKTIIENKRYHVMTVRNRTWQVWDKKTGECYLGIFINVSKTDFFRVLPSHLCTIVFKGKQREEGKKEIEKILGYIDD